MASRDIKIVVLGASSVGKTSILQRYCNGTFQPGTLPTIGAGFFTHSVVLDEMNVTLLLWDTAGEERFKAVTPSLLHGADALIIVYDVFQKGTFDEMEIYYDMFIDTFGIDDMVQLPILVLGNKIDLNQSNVDDAIVKQWCEKCRVPLEFRCSALSGENVNDSINKLVLLTLKSEKKTAVPALQISQPPPEKKKWCC